MSNNQGDFKLSLKNDNEKENFIFNKNAQRMNLTNEIKETLAKKTIKNSSESILSKNNKSLKVLKSKKLSDTTVNSIFGSYKILKTNIKRLSNDSNSSNLISKNVYNYTKNCEKEEINQFNPKSHSNEVNQKNKKTKINQNFQNINKEDFYNSNNNFCFPSLLSSINTFLDTHNNAKILVDGKITKNIKSNNSKINQESSISSSLLKLKKKGKLSSEKKNEESLKEYDVKLLKNKRLRNVKKISMKKKEKISIESINTNKSKKITHKLSLI